MKYFRGSRCGAAKKVKKGDRVRVISGKSRGLDGEVLEVLPDGQRARVGGVGVLRRHTKPSQTSGGGGIVERPVSINLSNLAPLSKSGAHGRVGFRFRSEDGKKVRFLKSSREDLDV